MKRTFKQFRAKALKDPAVKAEYDNLSPGHSVAKAGIRQRIRRLISF